MSFPDLIVLAFAAFHGARIAGDQGGAIAVSCWTRVLFALSHLTTVIYALVVLEDLFKPVIAQVCPRTCLRYKQTPSCGRRKCILTGEGASLEEQIMFSLLAIVVTAVLLGSALVWRAIQTLLLSRARPVAILRGLWRNSTILIAQLLPRGTAPKVARNWWHDAR